MMRGLLIVLLIKALPAAAEPPAGSYPFVLYTSFQSEPSQTMQGAIQDEVDSIMSPMGWQFIWDSLSNSDKRVCSRLAVVHFRGTCSAVDLTPYPDYRFVLGSTAISDGGILPFTDIYCDAIRATLAPNLKSMEPSMREWAYGRAVGRVLVHELYHIFANKKSHSLRGLAEAEFTPQELLSDKFRFDNSQVQALRVMLYPALMQKTEGYRPSGWEKGPLLFTTSGCGGCHGPRGKGTQWGPAIQDASRHCDSAKLAARLKDHTSTMYKRAAELNVLWPRLTGAEVDALAAYLRSLTD